MSGVAWALATLLLTGAAVVAAWPVGAALRRLDSRRRIRRRPVTAADLRRLRSRIRAFADRSPRRALGAAGLTGLAVGLILSGPVAGLVLAVYGALGARAVMRRAARRRATAARSRSLDDLNALAADLRAGLAVGPLSRLSSPEPATSARELTADRAGESADPEGGDERPDPRLAELTAAVWRLAEQTGAPAADLVERIEADARAGDRARAAAAAQAAGAQATAVLLAALPVGGIALGYGIGADPLRVLLTTVPGAMCAIAAVLLQSGGLLWADRLARGPEL
jgi:tight adherence protein B